MKRREFVKNTILISSGIALWGCGEDSLHQDSTRTATIHLLDTEGNYVNDAQLLLNNSPRNSNNGIYNLDESEFGTYDLDFTSDSVWNGLLAVRSSINGNRTAKKDAQTRENSVPVNGGNIYLIKAKKRDVASATTGILYRLNKDGTINEQVDATDMYGTKPQTLVPGVEFPRDSSLYKNFSIDDFVKHKDSLIFTPKAKYSIEKERGRTFLKDNFGSEYNIVKVFESGLMLENQFGDYFFLEAATSNNLDEIANYIDQDGTGTKAYPKGEVGFVLHKEYGGDVTKATSTLQDMLDLVNDAQERGLLEIRIEYKISDSGKVNVYLKDYNKHLHGETIDNSTNIIQSSIIEIPGPANLVKVEGTFPELQGAIQGQGLNWDVYKHLMQYNNDTNKWELTQLGGDVQRTHSHLGEDMYIKGASQVKLEQWVSLNI